MQMRMCAECNERQNTPQNVMDREKELFFG